MRVDPNSIVADSWTEYSWVLGQDGRALVKTTDLEEATDLADEGPVWVRRVTATGWRPLPLAESAGPSLTVVVDPERPVERPRSVVGTEPTNNNGAGLGMPAQEVIAELRERLEDAARQLIVLQRKVEERDAQSGILNTTDFHRLRGKVQGVKLALDYLRGFEGRV